MVGSVASSSARSNQGVGRFYHPPARRKQLELEQQLLQQQQQQQQQPPQPQPQQQQQPQPQTQPQQQPQQNYRHHQQHHHNHTPRHHHHQHQHHHQQQPRPARSRVRGMEVVAAAAAAAAASVEAREAESRPAESDDSSKHSIPSVSAPVSTAATSSSVASSSSPSPPPRPPTPPTPLGNLNQFIDSVTPVVNAKYLIKHGLRGRRNTEERRPYYVLEDLWDVFSEWSAYGAGVPIVLDDSESVTQYYVPYLSAIQLYVKDPSKPTTARHRCPGENSDGELYRDTSSEGSNECGADRRSVHAHEGNRRLTERLSRISLGENAHVNLEGSSSDDGEVQNAPGLLKFQYFERESPYGREPLAEKVSILSRQCPELMTYKSNELLQSSWLSVAWYPIYRIPTGPTLRDLESCFLTFHLLATPDKSIKNGYQDPGVSGRRSSGSDGFTRLPLPVIGLASYKFRDSVWITNGLCERQQVSSLLQAADSWVQGLQVDHPDFRFFMSHNSQYWR